MKFAVILPAAGSSSRYTATGGLRHKLDEDLGGKPVLQRTVELFTKFEPREGSIASIIVAGPAADEPFAEFKDRHADRLALLGASICRGGSTHRWETVRNALALVPPDCTHVAVHDAARPCASLELLDRVFDAARRHAAVIPAIDVPDTIKRVRDTGEAEIDDDPAAAILGAAPKGRTVRVVEATVPRENLVLVQTPQVFEVGLLRRAYAQEDLSSTDDASLIERLAAAGDATARVTIVEGESRNIKITKGADLAFARQIMGLKETEGRAVHKRF
ncbi:MAG: 2-C-methyl-D-erythritol 4-phosphate cytidylyltransferase [Phycisphaerales bacterium]|jgi:2-C-methyl-D-erythritol 4-phosphate cytidylyltransferase